MPTHPFHSRFPEAARRCVYNLDARIVRIRKDAQFETVVMKKDYSDDWPPFVPLTLEWEVEMVVEESGIRPRRRGTTHRRKQPDVRGLALPPRTLSTLLAQAAHEPHQHAPTPAPPALSELSPSVGAVHPDLTLEHGDFATRDFEVDRVRQTHTCRDFETAWDYNARWLDWYYFLKEIRLSTTPSLEFE
ncbi:hypothetical protein EDB92DRAFT_1944428 [Lactarius akahatsu]|uniref:Uncharacterized protein n=1 Tax=Lactarius akahatsu TaxID=416441 RepID=A0AAD4QEL7_9AGAM|nr:hypothetical protein EDB92DRAFT_1944428 [Lactarius akahatsu]